MKITYYEQYLSHDRLRCVEYPHEAIIPDNFEDYKQGNLYYFKTDKYNYLVLSYENGKWYR